MGGWVDNGFWMEWGLFYGWVDGWGMGFGWNEGCFMGGWVAGEWVLDGMGLFYRWVGFRVLISHGGCFRVG